MNKVFFDYSKYYDLLYKDKNYLSETKFIIELIKKHHPNAKTILNLGCGTGSHDLILAQNGFEVVGIDLSENMISIAKEKNTSKSCTFIHGDARQIKLDKKFDVVISLFHVFSYQNSNQDALDFLKTIYQSLREDGLAIFDYWYGPAVLNIKPEKRFKKMESNDLIIERHAETQMILDKNIAEVHFDVLVKNKSTQQETRLSEKHPMRYFFDQELTALTKEAGLKYQLQAEWLKDTLPNKNTWAAYSVLVKNRTI